MASYAQLSELLRSDPDNLLLLAEAADAAIAEGAHTHAANHIAVGERLAGSTPQWVFRRATLAIAQGELGSARQVLERLRAEGQQHPAIDHNLAHVAFSERDFVGCIALLEPWLTRQTVATEHVAPLRLLWLRALHHLEDFEGAWKWISTNRTQLDAPLAGVASLIAFDNEEFDAARALAEHALQKSADHPEALLAAASLDLMDRNTTNARHKLERLTEVHPHQYRGWTMLGIVELVEGKGEAAHADFSRALAQIRDEPQALLGDAWAQVLLGNLDVAESTFARCAALDPLSADAKAGLAVVMALGGQKQRANAHAKEAEALEPEHGGARVALALLEEPGPRDVRLRKLLSEALGALASGRTPH